MSEENKSPILIYQMGKVGSMTVYKTCEKLNLDVPIYHLHTLVNFAEFEKTILFNYARPETALKPIKIGKQVVADINNCKYNSWQTITLVREPIARNISDFFQLIVQLTPDFYRKYDTGEITLNILEDLFLNRFDYNRCLTWLDRELNRVFQIDIYAEEFDRERGYKIYHLPGIDLLLIKLEHFPNCLQLAIAEFLQVDSVEIVDANASQEKPYQKIYRDFLDKIVIPPDYLDLMYDSPFARKFYCDRELKQFREYWSK